MTVASILWNRLDLPGHDACRLIDEPGRWSLHGSAVFAHEGTPASLVYSVTCDRDWQSHGGRVRGWIGPRPIDLQVARLETGAWTLNGDDALPPMDCVDLDFGFTPATNLLALRRLNLAVGEDATIYSAWLDVGGALEVIEQRYRRTSDQTYWYESPRFEYTAELEVDGSGFVRRYPRLWQAVGDE